MPIARYQHPTPTTHPVVTDLGLGGEVADGDGGVRDVGAQEADVQAIGGAGQAGNGPVVKPAGATDTRVGTQASGGITGRYFMLHCATTANMA